MVDILTFAVQVYIGLTISPFDEMVLLQEPNEKSDL
jgi:hypothetical protein